MSVAPEISVLLVNWNTRDLVERCLDSLGAGISSHPFETIVVDNGSTDGSVACLRDRSDIDLVENRENRGFAEAVNQAYRRSQAPFVLLLNSDVELPAGSIDTLMRLLRDEPRAAGAAPLYRSADGEPQPFHFRFPSFLVTLANASAPLRALPGISKRIREHRMLDEDFSAARRVPQPSASCLLLRREVLERDRVFDERYPIFFNDVQLARSLARAGHELWVTPESVVIHEEHASTRQLGGAIKRQYVASVVRMLGETEPAWKVLLYRMVVLLQGLALLALRRHGALSLTDLLGAVRGIPGPLPTRPSAVSP